MEYEEEIDLLRYGRFLARYWLVLAACLLAGALAGLAWIKMLPERYQVTATLVVKPGSGTPFVLTSGTVKAFIANLTLVSETITESGLDQDGWTAQAFLQGALDVQVVPASNLVRLTVTVGDATKARVAASLLATKIVDLSRRLDLDSASASREALVKHADTAERDLKVSEERLMAFQMSADLERLELAIRSALEAQQRQGPSAQRTAELNRRRAEFYSRRLELGRRQADYDARLRVFTDARMRLQQPGAGAMGQLQIIDPPIQPAGPVRRPVAQSGALGGLVGLMSGVVVALLMNRRRMDDPQGS